MDSLSRMVLVFSLFAGAGDGQERTEADLDEDLETMIEAGVEFVRSCQRDDGMFRSHLADKYPDGVTALCLLALRASGVPADDPAIEKGLAFINTVPLSRTYSTALRILALDTLEDPAHHGEIRAAADWLLERFVPSQGGWGYFDPEGGADPSNTHFAVWARDTDTLNCVPFPNPGAKGVICIHPKSREIPVQLLRKVKVFSKRSKVALRLSSCFDRKGNAFDFEARLGVYDRELKWLRSEIVLAGDEPSPEGWIEFEEPLSDYVGKEILLVLQCAAGGPQSKWWCENAFVDEFSVKR